MAEALKSLPEQRVLLPNVSWGTYERLLKEREERRAPRFFYDRGVLEILSPSKGHETVAGIVASLVKELAVEFDLDVEGAGSTTFKREDLDRGFEPDECFYFRNIERVRGKADINLDAGDPPPDLVVEVDITSPSLNKLPVYARLGVREVWRYVGQSQRSFDRPAGPLGRPTILALQGVAREDGEGYYYAEVTESIALPLLTNDVLARFVEEGLTSSYPAWVRQVREWARELR